MRTTLRAEVELCAVTVLAELAVLERRPELALVCQAAARGLLEPRVVGEVLPGLSEMACVNVQRHCEYLGLCDEAGRLTEAGRRCAEHAEAPVPEQGVYTLWVARHPLCGTRLLHMRRERVDPRDSDFDSLESVPEWIQADRRRAWSSVVERDLRFCLRELLGPPRQPVPCRLAPVPSCQLSWEIDLSTGANQWWLAGQLEWKEENQPRRAPFSTAPESITDLDTVALFAAWESRWSARQGFVAMNFDGQVEGASPFRRTLTYPSVSVPARGSYNNVEVLDVPVGPSGPVQAQRWVDALLLAALRKESGYVPAPRLNALFAEQVRGTPLSGFPVRLAEVEDHLKSLGGDERLYWMLAAPFDLRPEPPSSAVKGAV